MKRVNGLPAVLAGIMLALAGTPALAQTPADGQAATPSVAPTKWYLGVLSGAQVVERSKPLAGIEFGIRVKGRLQMMVEAGWFRDVVTSSRVNEVNFFANYIQQAEGQTASGSIDAPAWFGLGGLRYSFENASGIRPYVFANLGMARVEYRPTFILDDQNISGAVNQYGVTLGRDLLGSGNHFAYGGGAGLMMGDKWYLDLGARLTRIQTPDHATDVRRISIGIGHRF